MLDQALLLEKTSHILIGAHDFQKLAQEAVDLIFHELKNDGIVGVGILRVHSENNELYAYAYNALHKKLLDKILPIPFSKMHLTLDAKDNLLIRSVHLNQMQQTDRLADATKHVIPDVIADQIQKILGMKLFVAIPITSKSGRVSGVIIYDSTTKTISPALMSILQTFARQLGLAFSNIFAFEKLARTYKKEFNAQTIQQDQVPSVKFTLRLTPQQIKKLDSLASERSKTKAELIRELLDKQSPIA